MLGDKILIAYASKCGSTKEVAEAIDQVFSQAGVAVDVRRVQDVKDLSPYRVVVLGTAIRMEKPLSEAIAFVKKHRAGLNQLPLACFSLGIQMHEDTPENRKRTMAFLAPLLRAIKTPVSIGLLGGKVDYSTLSPIWRFIASHDQSRLMREGDWRNWEAIRAWAAELFPAFARVGVGF
jgi:menaquinone-dependent protoporphyrinogen oxidase